MRQAMRNPARSRHTLRQLGTFAVIGVCSTLSYAALFLLLRGALPAQLANAAALLITAIGNTAANRRLTFQVRGPDRLARDHAAGLVALGAALTITSSTLAILGVVAPDAGRIVELAALVLANALATCVRFLVLRFALERGHAPVVKQAGLGTPVPAHAIARAAVRPGAHARSRFERSPR